MWQGLVGKRIEKNQLVLLWEIATVFFVVLCFMTHFEYFDHDGKINEIVLKAMGRALFCQRDHPDNSSVILSTCLSHCT